MLVVQARLPIRRILEGAPTLAAVELSAAEMAAVISEVQKKKISQKLKVYRRDLIDRGTKCGRLDLGGGTSGDALFLSELGATMDDERASSVARKLIQQTLKKSASTEMTPSFFQGLSGILWASSLILGKKNLRQLMPKSFQASYLSFLSSHLSHSGFFELTHGATGWAIMSETFPGGKEFSERVAKYLRKTRSDGGKPLWIVRPGQLELIPEETIVFGIAHGIFGPLLLYSKTAWVKEAFSLVKKNSFEPLFTSPLIKVNAEKPQSAWCYGDAGSAYALSVLARRHRLKKEAAFADDLFLRGVSGEGIYRPVKGNSICHGLSGMILLSYRHWQLTRDPRSFSALSRWLNRGLDEIKLSSEESGLLNGSAGTALTLLNIYSGKKPIHPWDRAFLLDLPGRNAHA